MYNIQMDIKWADEDYYVIWRNNYHTNEIRISYTERGSRIYLQIREWFYNKVADEWWPTKRGVSIPEENVPDLMEALRYMTGGL
jgi:hypothetical protein